MNPVVVVLALVCCIGPTAWHRSQGTTHNSLAQASWNTDGLVDCYVSVLIAIPFDVPVPDWAPEAVWESLKRLALRSEIVGSHERWRTSFPIELQYVRCHLRTFAGAPSLSCILATMDESVARNALQCNLTYQEYLNCRKVVHLHIGDEIEDALEESRLIAAVWTAAVEACESNTNSWVSRRRHLQRLQELLGDHDFYAGKLPPAAPTRRFAPR